MAAGTAIEWVRGDDGSRGHTWNPIRARDRDSGRAGHHCEHVSEGCRFCYAETFNRRFGTGLPFKPGHRGGVEIYLDEKVLQLPLHWKKPRRIFAGSMTDLAAAWVTDAQLDRIFAVAALCPQHTFIFATKRPERIAEYMTAMQTGERAISVAAHRMLHGEGQAPHVDLISFAQPLPNVWLLTSVDNQETADARISHLLRCPAAVRGISLEPMLGPVDLRPWLLDDDGCESCDDAEGFGLPRCTRLDIPREEQCPKRFAVFDTIEHPPFDADGTPAGLTVARRTLDWVILGGESGRNARPLHPDWVRAVRDQCRFAGVPFFFKQWGEWAPIARWSVAGRQQVALMWDGSPVPFDVAPEDVGGHRMERTGKKAAGAVLDGRTWTEFPQPRMAA